MFRCKVDEEIELRVLELRHAPELFALIQANRLHLREWLSWVDMSQSVEDVQRFIAFSLNGFAQNNGFSAGIWYKGALVGVIGHFMPIDWTNGITRLTCWLSHALLGKGIATRSCRAVIGHAFKEMGLNRVEIRCAVDNIRSRNIPKRLGFTEECILRCGEWGNGQYRNSVIYGMTANNWGQA